MRKTLLPPENMRLAVQARVATRGVGKGSTELGVTPETVRRILSGRTVTPETVARLARTTNPKGPDRIRSAKDFEGAQAVEAPRREQPIVAWDLERIRMARDAQMRGDFKLAVRLAEAIRTDDALFAAYHNRIAPQSAVAIQMTQYPGVRGMAVMRKAQDSVFVPRAALTNINGTLANHAVAIGYNHHEVNDEGTIVNFRHVEWPLEWVRWNPSREQLETTVRNGGFRVPIVHGDGRWVVYRKSQVLPWTQEAALLPAAFVWAAHANGIRDWAAGSKSHGEAKVIGTLPSGLTIEDLDADGMPKLTDQAFGFLQMLRQIMSGENPVGVMPFGSEVDVVTNASTMYQVFSELILSREKAAARIYLGTDAMLGAAGGAPGVDIATLFGVAATKIQGDFTAIEQGLNTGVYQPWCAINEGDSRYAPSAVYQLPDPDDAAKRKEESDNQKLLLDTVAAYRANGMAVTQDTVNALAVKFNVKDPPQIVYSFSLQPTDVRSLVLGKEARAQQGLPPFGDDRDNMTLTEIDAAAEARGTLGAARITADAKIATAAPPASSGNTAPAALPTPAGNTSSSPRSA
jgi:hypothetical protein